MAKFHSVKRFSWIKTAAKDNKGNNNIKFRTPHLEDPYENIFVEVKRSFIPDAGQGLFAKTGKYQHFLHALFLNFFMLDLRQQNINNEMIEIGLKNCNFNILL